MDQLHLQLAMRTSVKVDLFESMRPMEELTLQISMDSMALLEWDPGCQAIGFGPVNIITEDCMLGSTVVAF